MVSPEKRKYIWFQREKCILCEKDLVPRQRAGASRVLHVQALKVLETLLKKYLLVGIGDIDQSYVTIIDLGRRDILDVPAVVIESEFCHLSERAQFN
jgi:hypothetical protein